MKIATRKYICITNQEKNKLENAIAYINKLLDDAESLNDKTGAQANHDFILHLDKAAEEIQSALMNINVE